VVYDLPPGLPLPTTVTSFALSALDLVEIPLQDITASQVRPSHPPLHPSPRPTPLAALIPRLVVAPQVAEDWVSLTAKESCGVPFLVAHGRRDNSEGDAAACVFAYEWGARRDVRGESSADRCVSVCERVYCNEVTSWSSARFPFCGCPLVMKVEGFVDNVLSSFKWSLGADPNPSCEEVCAGPCVATSPPTLTSPSRVGGRPHPHNGTRLFAA
jgi:hypothetical protein